MAINPNMVAIQTVTVGAGGAANIEFTAIPQTYSDLVVKLSARTAEADNATWLFVDFNNSGLTKTSRTARGNGTTTSSFTQAAGALIGYVGGNTATASVFSTWEMLVPSYAQTTYNKSACIEFATEDNASGYQGGFVGLVWPSTSAITSIQLTPNATTFQQYTTATLYGLSSAGLGAKATGGAIYQDETYFYHVFGSTGIFTPSQSLTADILTIAGGGSGGLQYAGGGGAGGLAYTASAALNNGTSYTCTVGAGAAKAVDSGTRNGTNGSNSTFAGSGFSTITAVGGGYGGGDNGNVSQAGGAGGSGGGGTAIGAAAGGGRTVGQGNVGGDGGGTSTYGGGGGGAGESGNTDGNGFGGDGTSAYTSWGSATGTGQNVSGVYFYAGGGGGSRAGSTAPEGGSGGGGQGGKTTGGQVGGTAGTVNTGGGGGAGWGGQNDSGAGGSGLVIIRYAK